MSVFFLSDHNLHSIITAVMHISGREKPLIIFLITDKNVIVISHTTDPGSHFLTICCPLILAFGSLEPRLQTQSTPARTKQIPSNQIKLQGVKGLRLNKNT